MPDKIVSTMEEVDDVIETFINIIVPLVERVELMHTMLDSLTNHSGILGHLSQASSQATVKALELLDKELQCGLVECFVDSILESVASEESTRKSFHEYVVQQMGDEGQSVADKQELDWFNEFLSIRNHQADMMEEE